MKTRRLGDIATYINGYAFKPEDRGEKGLPIIRIQDLTGSFDNPGFYDGDYPARIEINDGDILISWSASLGVYIWNRGKALLNQHIFKVVFDKAEVDKTYFVYAVQYYLKEMERKTHGATMKHIVKKDFDNTEIPFPEKEKQIKIAKELSTISRMIESRRQQLQKLDELVKSRFIEMFGDPKLNPRKWDVVTIGDIATDVRYGTSRPATEGGKYPYLRMNNLTYEGYLDLTDLKHIDIPDNEIEKCVVRNGDVLFNRTNSVELVGKTCVYNLDSDMIIAGYIIRVRIDDRVLPVILSSYLNSTVMKEQLRSMAKGAVNQANINAQELRSIPIYLPPITLQHEFATFVEQVDKSKFAVQQALDKAQILFDSLMQKYFG